MKVNWRDLIHILVRLLSTPDARVLHTCVPAFLQCRRHSILQITRTAALKVTSTAFAIRLPGILDPPAKAPPLVRLTVALFATSIAALSRVLLPRAVLLLLTEGRAPNRANGNLEVGNGGVPEAVSVAVSLSIESRACQSSHDARDTARDKLCLNRS